MEDWIVWTVGIRYGVMEELIDVIWFVKKCKEDEKKDGGRISRKNIAIGNIASIPVDPFAIDSQTFGMNEFDVILLRAIK